MVNWPQVGTHVLGAPQLLLAGQTAILAKGQLILAFESTITCVHRVSNARKFTAVIIDNTHDSSKLSHKQANPRRLPGPPAPPPCTGSEASSLLCMGVVFFLLAFHEAAAKQNKNHYLK